MAYLILQPARFASDRSYLWSGELLLHHFTLTLFQSQLIEAVYFLLHFLSTYCFQHDALGFPRCGTLCCPDFPYLVKQGTIRLSANMVAFVLGKCQKTSLPVILNSHSSATREVSISISLSNPSVMCFKRIADSTFKKSSISEKRA